MGAVAWAIRHRSVSHPRSSNRTCRSPASGSPTGFTVRHTGSKPTARGFCTVITLLRPSTQQSRTAPVFDGVLRLIANHHDLAIFESAPEVRALSSAGITQLRRSYDPVRLPPWPPPVATLRPLPSPVTGLPRLLQPPFRRAVPTTPADQAGARVDPRLRGALPQPDVANEAHSAAAGERDRSSVNGQLLLNSCAQSRSLIGQYGGKLMRILFTDGNGLVRWRNHAGGVQRNHRN